MGRPNAFDSTKETFSVQTFIGSGLRISAVVSFLPFPHPSTKMARSSSAYSVKIAQICFGLGFLGVVLFGLRSMMRGSNTNMAFILGAVFLVLLVLVLDARYWILSAFLFGFYDTIPFIKFTGAELGALILVSVYCIRQALHQDTRSRSPLHLIMSAVPFLLWMMLVWSMNPTGLFIFGSTSIGGRFYFKIILAFLSMVCLSRMKFDEQSCKLLGFSIAAGYLSFTVMAVVLGNIASSDIEDGVHYSLIHLSYVAPLFLCRFTPSEILTRFWIFWGFFLSFGLSLFSGNRTAAARPVVVGLLASYFLKRNRIKSFGLFFCALFILSVVVAGHGALWHLPFAIQRPLSFLPGNWDRRLEGYGFGDSFRAELRYWAREQIKANPWFGAGGYALDHMDMSWGFSRRSGENIEFHVLARNWHNVWLGMAADFGIPMSVFWGLFMAVLMVSGYRWTQRLPPGSWIQTMYLYFYLLILTEFVNFFFQGGHSAKTAQQLFLWAGLLSAIRNGAEPFCQMGPMKLGVPMAPMHQGGGHR